MEQENVATVVQLEGGTARCANPPPSCTLSAVVITTRAARSVPITTELTFMTIVVGERTISQEAINAGEESRAVLAFRKLLYIPPVVHDYFTALDRLGICVVLR